MAWEEHSQRVGFWKELSLESFLALDIQFCIHDFFMKLVISKIFSSEKFYTNNNFLKNDKTWSLVFSEIWPVAKETENIIPRIWIQDSESLCFSLSHLAHHWHQNRAGACVYCPDLSVDVATYCSGNTQWRVSAWKGRRNAVRCSILLRLKESQNATGKRKLHLMQNFISDRLQQPMC